MKSTKLILAACCSSLLLTSGVLAQEKPKMPDMKELEKKAKELEKKVREDMQPKKDGAQPEGMPDAAAMEAMMKAMAPGEMHAVLAKQAGTWDCTMKMFMPGMPETPEKGTMTIEMIMGGRYQHFMYKGSFMGQAFEGAGTAGYNNVTKKFESTWMDNMGTGTMFSTGELDKEGKLVMHTEFADPMTGKMTKQREVTTHKSDNEALMEFYHTGADGKENKVMEIAMKRSGPAPAGDHGHDHSKDKGTTDKLKDDAEKKMKELQKTK